MSSSSGGLDDWASPRLASPPPTRSAPSVLAHARRQYPRSSVCLAALSHRPPIGYGFRHAPHPQETDRARRPRRRRRRLREEAPRRPCRRRDPGARTRGRRPHARAARARADRGTPQHRAPRDARAAAHRGQARPPHRRRLRRREEAAAAAEARNLGGPRLDDAHGDEAFEAVYEAGGGEAEGFEAAEDALIENATHGSGRADPIGDAFTRRGRVRRGHRRRRRGRRGARLRARRGRHRPPMILRPDGDGGSVVAIGQASHAWLSGQLARAWGNDAFAAPAPREEVVLGALQHDIGMADWDRDAGAPTRHRPAAPVLRAGPPDAPARSGRRRRSAS